MSQILIFSNNPLNEQPFEEKLRRLGHEVFTTKKLIDLCLLPNVKNEFVRIFHHIILSETLSNAEAKELAGVFSTFSIPLSRKSDESLEDTEYEEWKALGVTEWIESQPSIESLREKLSSDRARNEEKLIFLPRSENKLSLPNLPLSACELKLLRILYEQQEQTISREELCLRMWNREKNNSTMSQLSVTVTRLKEKLASLHITGPIIETFWGQGYRLDEAVYDHIYIPLEEIRTI